MYLWVVIATFMVALLSFNLSIRPDADRAYMEIKAQTVVTKFRAQHNAFKRYIESKRLSKTQVAYNANHNLTDTIAYHSGVGYNDNAFTGTNRSDILNDLAEFKKFLPYGFERDASIYSEVFCFKPHFEADYNYTTVCEEDDIPDAAQRLNCCAAPGVEVFVVSWQQMPGRWINRSTGIPISDMLAVITKSDGFGYAFGYVTKVDQVDYPVMSGGMYRTSEQIYDGGQPTGQYAHNLKYRPAFAALETKMNSNSEFTNYKVYTNSLKGCVHDGEIINPCLIAINKVMNREEN